MRPPNSIHFAAPSFGRKEQKAVARVLRSGQVTQGPEVALFEQEFSLLLENSVEAVATNSGTSSLLLGLLALGLPKGTEVIVPSFTFAATSNAVVLAGYKPVYIDILATSYCLDPKIVEHSITSKTGAIVSVPLFGNPAGISALKRLSELNGIPLVEDAAQAHGASQDGRPSGTWGDVGAFSFYPTKNMSSGEGGMLTTANPTFARFARIMRNQGMEEKYRNEMIGYNLRMTDIHAAIGRVQLKRLKENNARRIKIAEAYNRNLLVSYKPSREENSVHVYHQYTIRIPEDRDSFAAALLAEYSVPSSVFYPVPNHRLLALKKAGREGSDLGETERATKEVLSLPVHPRLSRRALEHIVFAVNRLWSAGS
jgi:dTDP-4-amino-4,6-dideoxygalactose transaminase